MTLITAAISEAGIVIVADRARALSGPCPRDESARKIIGSADRSAAIGIFGDVVLEYTGHPEVVVENWMPELIAKSADTRSAWLRDRVDLHVQTVTMRAGDRREGFLLLFNANAPNQIDLITTRPDAGTGVDVTKSTLYLSDDIPSVWGLRDNWSALTNNPWTAPADVADVRSALRKAIQEFAAANPKEIVSKDTDDFLVA